MASYWSKLNKRIIHLKLIRVAVTSFDFEIFAFARFADDCYRLSEIENFSNLNHLN